MITQSNIDSNFYSILYYNSCIWLTPDLSSDLKQNLLSIPANALRICVSYQGFDVSLEDVHKRNKKSTPKQLKKYQIALSLHKLINNHLNILSFDHIMVMDQVVCSSRQLRFQIQRKFNTKIGMNIAANKLFHYWINFCIISYRSIKMIVNVLPLYICRYVDKQ